MKYPYEESLQIVMQRGKKFRKEAERRTLHRLAAASAALTVLLVSAVTYLTHGNLAEADKTVFGAFLLPAQIGGYILVGVAAFSAGVAISLLTWRHRRAKAPPEDSDTDHK